ncbi:MAG: NUDIX domain-containing protein [Gemmatimonadales bacterium]|nr:NUDIX domain-containing protein [Gemmatimonadales bacterium]
MADARPSSASESTLRAAPAARAAASVRRAPPAHPRAGEPCSQDPRPEFPRRTLRGGSGRYLVCLRPRHKRHGGLWEFLGGKVEPGEALHAAAARELPELEAERLLDQLANRLATPGRCSPCSSPSRWSRRSTPCAPSLRSG